MPARLFYWAAQQEYLTPEVDSMTIDSGFYHTEMAGLTRFTKLGGRDRPARPAIKYLRPGFVWLPALLIAGFAAGTLFAGYSDGPAKSAPVRLAAASEPAPPAPAKEIAADAFSFDPAITAQEASPVQQASPAQEATVSQEATAPEQVAPVDGLKISSQSWRRGGLGSKALVTFTVRNSNDYAVKDIEIECAFSRRDGSHLTDRTHVIHGTVSTRSRKTFARQLVGFVNINADKAKCSLVAASHV